MTQKSQGTVGLVTYESFQKGLIKVGMKLRQEIGYDNHEGFEVNIVTVTGLVGGDIRIEGDGDGDWDEYDIGAFEPTVEEEVKSSRRLYFIDPCLANEFLLINVKYGTVVATGSRDEITAKVLDFRQCTDGEQIMAGLRIVPTAALKEVKLTLEL